MPLRRPPRTERLRPESHRRQPTRPSRRLRRTLNSLALASMPGEALGVIVVVGLLSIFGLIMVASASAQPSVASYGNSWQFSVLQGFFLVFGVAVAGLVAKIRFDVWRPYASLGLGISLTSLVAVFFMSPTIGGAQRWIPLGIVNVQPSEFAKLIVVIWVAHHVATQLAGRPTQANVVIPALGVAGAFFGLIYFEPDLGTASIVVFSVLAILLIGGISMRWFLPIAGAGLLVGMAAVLFSTYQRARIANLFDQGHHWLQGNYQLHHSKTALGSGGIFGNGLGQGTLKWGAIPNPHTDFIFSVIGEEFGLVGTVAVLLLFMVLVGLGVRIATRAPSTYGAFLAMGITTWLGLQTLINVASVVGFFPVTGVPLPFISYGGTSLVVDLMAAGLLVSVALSIPRGRLTTVHDAPTAATTARARSDAHRRTSPATPAPRGGSRRAPVTRPRTTR